MKNVALISLCMLILSSCAPKKDPLNRFDKVLPAEVVEQCIKENPNVSPVYCQLDLCLTSPFTLRALGHLLQETERVFKDVGLADRWWLEAGSLIGAMRYQAPPPWDDDIDLGILKDDFLPKFAEMQKLFAKRGLELQPVYQQSSIMGKIDREGLYQVSLSQGQFISQLTEWDSIEVERGNNKLSLDDYKNLWNSYNRRGRLVPSLDIILSDKFEKGIGYISNVFRDQCGYFEEKDFIDPSNKRTLLFLGKNYPVPANTEKYIEQCYKTKNIKTDVVIFSEHRSECDVKVRLRDVSKISGFTDYMLGYLRYIFPDKIL